jgi:HEAT repeat protein
MLKINRSFAPAIAFSMLLLSSCASARHTQVSHPRFHTAEIVQRFPAQSSSERDQAADDLIALGFDGILSVCSMLAPPGEKDDTRIRYALHGVTMRVNRTGQEVPRALYSRVLIKALQNAPHEEVKAFLIREIQLTAGDEAVSPLSFYLRDPRLCDPAAQALTAIGSTKVEASLRAALASASGHQRVILIRALGEMRSAAAVPQILAYANAQEPELRQVSLFALANIGDPAAEDVLIRYPVLSSAYERIQAPALLLRFAQRLGEAGYKRKTVRLCHLLIKNYTAPQESQIPCTALTILVDTLGETAQDDLLNSMDSPLKDVRARALELSLTLPGPGVTTKWLIKLENQPPEIQAEIIRMLGQRKDTTALPSVKDKLTSPHAALRQAAVTAASRLAGAEILSEIWPLLNTEDPGEISVIQQVLLQYPTAKIVPEAAARLEFVSAPAQVALIEILAERQAVQYADKVLQMTDNDQKAVHKAALTALEKLVSSEHISHILELLTTAEQPSDIPALQNALVAAAGQIPEKEERAIQILEAYEKSEDQHKPDLLRPLARIGGKAALQLVIRETATSIPRVRAAALYALSQWPEIQAAEPLLELCRRSDDPKLLYTGLQGYIRLVREAEMPAENKVSMLKEVMDLPLGTQEKNVLISGLSDVKSLAALELASGFLDEPEVASRAARAMLRTALPEPGVSGLMQRRVIPLLKRAETYIDDDYELQRISAHIAGIMQSQGFRLLFNEEDLEGWRGDTTGYVVEDGKIVVYPERGSGNLYTKDQFSDFILRFEFKLTSGANNGLGIRTPTDGDAAYVGMELQILDNSAPKYQELEPYQYHGSIYGIVPAKRGYQRPVGEWNYQEVTAQGRRITVELNGTVIVDADIERATAAGTMDGRDHPGLMNSTGHIGFLGHGSRVEFRNIWIKEIK